MTDVYAPPAFQLYASDWLARTELLTLEQTGALSRLKAHAWLSASYNLPPCSLPDDDVTLARLSGLGAKWRKLGRPVRDMFRPDDGRLYDDDLLAYRAEIQEHHNKRSAAGRIGNEKRWSGRSQSESQSDSHRESPSDRTASRDGIANASQNGRSLSSSSSASKSGAEAVSNRRPANAGVSHASNGAAPPAPLADARAADDQQQTAPLPSAAVLLLDRMPEAKQADGEHQLRAALTAQGARLKAGEYVRAASHAHLDDACRAVLASPPDKHEQLARWVLLKLRDTFTEWRSRDGKAAEQATAPTVAALVQPPAPVDELGEAHRWVHSRPGLQATIESQADARFEGFPKTAGMLRQHAQWIDAKCLELWHNAGSPTPDDVTATGSTT